LYPSRRGCYGLGALSLEKLLATRRVILVVGSGGVGKTTTTAALGLAAASRGKRVLCLTIDPARRLANSLGLKAMSTEAQTVDPQRFTDAGLAVRGTLTVMMLDTKSTFDELVHRYASTPQARDRILDNRLYQYISTSLAGTHEYMAMEKLHAVKSEGKFDLILLDTPPTTNALDFLDAPQRLVDALDSAAMRWFIDAFQESGKLSFNILAKSAAVVLKGIGKLTGGDFLEQVAQFVTELNDLFGGFKERAQEVARTLRAPDVAYVLVTSPSPMAIQEVLFFSERLEEQGMPRDAIVVNRLHLATRQKVDPAAVRQAVAAFGLALDDDAPERLARAVEDEARQAHLDEAHLLRLDEALARAAAKPIRVNVPALPYDVHDVRTLAEVAAVLVP